MKFGKTEHPESIDFALLEDDTATRAVLEQSKGRDKDNGKPQVYVGCAKWNPQDLKQFYPRCT